MRRRINSQNYLGLEENKSSERVDFVDFIRMTLNEEISFLRGSTERITPDAHLDQEMFTDKTKESEVPMDTGKTKSLRESYEVAVLFSAAKQFSGSSKSCTESLENYFGDSKHSDSSKMIFKDVFSDFYKVNLVRDEERCRYRKGYHDSFFFLFKEPDRNSKGDDSISKEEDQIDPPLECNEENNCQDSHQHIIMNSVNMATTNI